jgi:hypothetical protein
MRDTEVDKVFWNKEIVKAMLLGISRSTTKLDDINKPPNQTFEEVDNPNWLFGPIMG